VPVADIVAAAVAEDADVIGISVLSGAHCRSLSSCSPRCAPPASTRRSPSAGRSHPGTPPTLRRLGVAACSPWAPPLPGVVEGVLMLASAGGSAVKARHVPGVRAGNRSSGSPGPPGPPVTTDSGIPVAPVYTAQDVAGGPDALAARLGRPGEPPFTRGPYESMYRGQLWTMRQFAGYGSPEETNARFHFLIGRGQTALSVAFDLPTSSATTPRTRWRGPRSGG
jgi:hypothetical protein